MKKKLPLFFFIIILSDLLAPVYAKQIDTTIVNENTEDENPPKPGFWERLFPKKPAKIEPKYPVIVDIDSHELRELIEEHLPLITQQQIEELDSEQIEFLVEEAPEQIQTMLETEGYFNSKVKIDVNNNHYTIHITEGPRTKVTDVDIAILGDIQQDNNLSTYYNKALSNWSLPVGHPFTQNDWSNSKAAVLSTIVQKKYPLASIQESKATINPVSNQANLNLTIQSKQPIYFGPIIVTGTERYPESVVLGMARFATGDPYDLEQLLDYQQALEQDSHYSSAIVQADFKQLKDNQVPVQVEVNEVKKKKLELGIRYDSHDGPGYRIGYDRYNLFGKGYVGSVVWDRDKYETNFSLGVSQPRQSSGYFWTTNVSYQRSTLQNLEKDTISNGLWLVKDKNDTDIRYGLEYVSDHSEIKNGPSLGRSNAMMVTASWRKQNIETQLRPANGYYLYGKVGTTAGTLLSSTYMQRVNASASYYFTPENKQYGTWIIRGQMGYVRARDDADVPASLMFRTGGATSVRGYEQDGIGIAGPNDSVLPDRVMGVASIEYQMPIYQQFALAIFHDAGSISHKLTDTKWEQGTGLGLRWFSPLAPFSFDVAHGHEDKKIRWNISLGARF